MLIHLSTLSTSAGHSAANAVARIGSLFSPFLIQGDISLVKKGFVMLAIHCVTVACVSRLPETKGSHMGREHTEEIEDSALTIEQDDYADAETEQVPASDHVIT
jgi:hypothetical protein